MNGSEYKLFFGHLIASYPTVANRFEGEPDAEERNAVWVKALMDCEYQHCMDAIDSMVRGDIERPQYGWDDLPKIIRMYSFAKSNEELQTETWKDYEGESSYRVNCQYCQDTGFVRIWNPLFVKDREANIALCEDRAAVYELYRTWKATQKRENPKRVAHGYGAMVLVVVCVCEHPIAQIKRRHIDDWRDLGKPSNKIPVPCYEYRPNEWDVYRLGEPEELE